MPEVLFTVRWPDGSADRCYSPSTVIGDYLAPGSDYPLDDFVARCRAGLGAASERVRQRYGGSGCAHAISQLAAIEAKATAVRILRQDGSVRIEEFTR